MKIPKSFILGAVDWDVVITPDFPIGDNQTGESDYKSAKITVYESPKRSVTEQTYCHELMHSFFFHAGETDHDEKLIDKLANGLHQYLKQVYK